MSDTQFELEDDKNLVSEKVKFAKFDETLTPEQRQWANNVLRALGLKSANAQARLFAGAIASTASIELNGSVTDKRDAKKLKDIVMSKGPPPWKNPGVSMEVASAKVQLDLLSIPEEQRKLQPLGDQQGINSAFWINRKDPDGQVRHAFLCKPGGTSTGGLDDKAPSGGPKGGEVMREALSGRAAEFLAGATGIDIGMPETHVVKLDGEWFGQSSEKITCSVQEARLKANDLKTLPPKDRKEIDRKQVAALAIFDTITLNTDRHGGNIMVGPKGRLIPIDHGESFAEPSKDGLGRLRTTLAGPHNAILSIPSAHEPLLPEMANSLSSISTSAYGKTLHGHNKGIATEHKDLKGAVSDDAIETAKRAARFVKLAAKHVPPLSPAAIQIALGSSVPSLFPLDEKIDEEEFETRATAAIDRIAPHGQSLKEICTAPDPEWNTLKSKANKLGWVVAARSGKAPIEHAICDPVLLLTICANNIKGPAPCKASEHEEAVAKLQGDKGPRISPKQALEEIFSNRIVAIQEIMPTTPEDQQKGLTQACERFLGKDYAELPINQRLRETAEVCEIALQLGTNYQSERLAKAVSDNSILGIIKHNLLQPPPLDHENAQAMLDVRDPVSAAETIGNIESNAAQGKYIPAASKLVAGKLRKFADTMLIPHDNKTLVDGLQAAAINDLFEADYSLRLLRAESNAFAKKALEVIGAELEELKRTFTIDPTDTFLGKAIQALQKGNPEDAHHALDSLTSKCLGNSYAPSPQAMEDMAKKLGVPETDEDLVEAMKAARGSDAQTALSRWKKVRQRVKDNEFGLGAFQNATEALNELLKRYKVPEDHQVLKDAKSALAPPQSADLVKALVYIGKLERLAKAGAFLTP